ncbi:MAG: hypothetical protein FWD66_09760 [Paludibacter sp.]|nr:hypothetical protein [Paludibacter sp.]
MNVSSYTISTKTIDFVARIAEKLGEKRGAGEFSRNLCLRKINRLEELPARKITDINTDKLSKTELEFLEQIVSSQNTLTLISTKN